MNNGVRPTIFYFNPNIWPLEEYEIRKNESKRHAESLGIKGIDGDQDHGQWRCDVQGLEGEPERGKRCDICFQMRLKRAFEYAKANGFDRVTSVLGFSRYKDFDQVNRAAMKTGGENLYDTTNWRKNGLQELSRALSEELSLYNQNYCGCKPRNNT